MCGNDVQEMKRYTSSRCTTSMCKAHRYSLVCVFFLDVYVQGAQHTSTPVCVSFYLMQMCTTRRHHFVCRNLKSQCARRTCIILCVVTLKFSVHDTQALFCVS